MTFKVPFLADAQLESAAQELLRRYAKSQRRPAWAKVGEAMSHAFTVLLGVWPIVVGAALYSLGSWSAVAIYVAGCAAIDWFWLDVIDRVRGRR